MITRSRSEFQLEMGLTHLAQYLPDIPLPNAPKRLQNFLFRAAEFVFAL